MQPLDAMFWTGEAKDSRDRQSTWAGGAPAGSSVGRGGMRGGEQRGLMLPFLPEGTAPVPHTQQHIFKEGRPLQADDGSIVCPHTGLAVIWMLLTLYA